MKEAKLYRLAFALALFTIIYNVVEGIISTWLGLEDESLALFGFGMDSFIEVISGMGILFMIKRIRNNPGSPRAPFEKTALKITGSAFYALVMVLIATASWKIITAAEPETTIWGIVISLISIAVMWALVAAKKKVGNDLNSAPIIADANCTKVCLYMSVILLVSSVTYELTGWPYVDSLGALGLAWYSYSEGRESFEKAAGEDYCVCD